MLPFLVDLDFPLSHFYLTIQPIQGIDCLKTLLMRNTSNNTKVPYQKMWSRKLTEHFQKELLFTVLNRGPSNFTYTVKMV